MTNYAQKFSALRLRNSERDKRMREVALVRGGHANQVFPGLFPEGAWSRPIIANLIDVAAKDYSEQVGVLPTVTAAGDSAVNDSSRSKADRRTKIASYYMAASKMGTSLISGADQFGSYGFLTFRVEPNMNESRPHIHVEPSNGSYFDVDRFGNVLVYATLFQRKAGDLAALFPELADKILKKGMFGATDESSNIEVVRWYDKNTTVLFLPSRDGMVLAQAKNLIGRVPVAIARKPSLDGESRGNYDDVLSVFAAKARLAVLTMEAVQKSVEAPLALPQDVTRLNIGPDAIIRSNSPEKIRRVPLDVPQYAFAQNNNLGDELRLGTRFPQSRAGQAEGSIVTGQGVKALESAFDSQVKTAQGIIGEAIADAISIAYTVDDVYFANVKHVVSGGSGGVPFKFEYTPSKDINGNYGVTVEYGLMAGLDPNRALVFALQARGDKLLSRGFVRRNLPISLNASEEESAIDMEEMRDSLKAGVASLAAAIPQMTAQGQDPTAIIEKMARVISERKKGTPLEEAVARAFAPPKPPPTPEQAPPNTSIDPNVPDVGAGPASAPGAPAPTNEPVQNEALPQGPPAMQQLLAGLSGSGEANLASRVVRQVPA